MGLLIGGVQRYRKCCDATTLQILHKMLEFSVVLRCCAESLSVGSSKIPSKGRLSGQ
jgi:hypothetical protein